MYVNDSLSTVTPNKISIALKRASEATGAGVDFLKLVAERESSLNPAAKAKTSSAAGLFQFIDQTWLGAVKQYGARHGLGDQAGDIQRGSDGRFNVSSTARREEILALRFDANTSATLAGELANQNQSILENRLGRATSNADLYTAHFLGPAGAAKLLSASASLEAADLLPTAAAANRAVFYDGARAKTVGEVVSSIASSMSGASETDDVKTSSTPSRTASVDQGMTYGPSAPKSFFAMEAIKLESNAERLPARSAELAPPPAVSSRARVSEPAISPLRAYTALGASSRLSTFALSALQGLDPTRGFEDILDGDKRT